MLISLRKSSGTARHRKQVTYERLHHIGSDQMRLGFRRNGASEDFVRSLKHVTEQELIRQHQDLCEHRSGVYRIRMLTSFKSIDAQSCPVCQLSYAEILTEQEYAESTDHYIGGANADLGLRRLPCQTDTGDQEASLGGHIMCGRCARKWLRLVSSRRIVKHSSTLSYTDAAPELCFFALFAW
jgi:hypothetical protein